jgi:hypothetical protein
MGSCEMSASRSPGWEYLILGRSEAERLNELGREGWELVAVSKADDGVELFLKRPLPGFREQITLEQRSSYVGEDVE